MAPKEIEEQTGEIIKCLFVDEDLAVPREGVLQPDGCGDDDDDTFDAVIIADKLREVGDLLSKDAGFQNALKQLRQAAAQQAMAEAFSKTVEALCQTTMPQKAEVAPEMQLIRASFALGVYIKKNAPELKDRVRTAMTTFLNTRVGNWVAQQGGWDVVADDAQEIGT